MKRIIVGDTKVYISPDYGYGEQGVLRDGSIVELGGAVVQNNSNWIEVIKDDKVWGYISGDSKLLNLENCIYINQKWVDSYKSPDIKSDVVKKYNKYDEIFIAEKVESDNKSWYKIYDIFGISGYIEAETYLLSSNICKTDFALIQDSVNVYDKPDESSDKIDCLYAGHKIIITKPLKDSSGNMWFKISTESGEGYIIGTTYLEDYKTYIIKQQELDNKIKNISPIKLFFLTYSREIFALSLIFIGLILLIFGAIMKSISSTGCFLLAAGIVSWLLDLSYIELYRFIRRR
ncbi:MAG: SH3 domain-containing protein [Bacillota bacterium]|nr:SH3 domain-containing protein [Bacillota bacterium]